MTKTRYGVFAQHMRSVRRRLRGIRKRLEVLESGTLQGPFYSGLRCFRCISWDEDLWPYLHSLDIIRVGRTFLGMLHTQAEEDSSARRGVGRDSFQVPPKNNREYTPGLLPHEEEWKHTPIFVRKKKLGRTGRSPMLCGEKVGRTIIGPSKNADSSHLFMRQLRALSWLPPTTIWEPLSLHFLQSKDGEGVLALQQWKVSWRDNGLLPHIKQWVDCLRIVLHFSQTRLDGILFRCGRIVCGSFQVCKFFPPVCRTN